MLQKLKFTIFIPLIIFGLMPFASQVHASSGAVSESTCKAANPPPECACHPEYHGGTPLSASDLKNCNDCNSYNGTDTNALNSQAKTCLSNNKIVKDINVIVDVLAGMVTVVSIAMMIVGGIQYSVARNNPNAVGAARKRVANAAFALVGFFFIWAFLQWLVPGGVFKS